MLAPIRPPAALALKPVIEIFTHQITEASHLPICRIATSGSGLDKNGTWRYAVEERFRAQGWEAGIALVHRIPQAGAATQFLPIRFVAANKLSNSDKTISSHATAVPWRHRSGYCLREKHFAPGLHTAFS
jgi:hypothetical protein